MLVVVVVVVPVLVQYTAQLSFVGGSVGAPCAPAPALSLSSYSPCIDLAPNSLTCSLAHSLLLILAGSEHQPASLYTLSDWLMLLLLLHCTRTVFVFYFFLSFAFISGSTGAAATM